MQTSDYRFGLFVAIAGVTLVSGAAALWPHDVAAEELPCDVRFV
jgi:hypothetical protein